MRDPGPLQPAAQPRAAGADAAEGRRTLSAAFVRVGPDGHLTVGLRDGRTIVLRDVALRAKDYCGKSVPAGGSFCGHYADVATARPGGGPRPDGIDAPGADASGIAARPAEPR